MNKKIVCLALALMLAISVLVFPATVSAEGATTQVTITKYAADGTTVLQQVTKTVDELEAGLPVKGDGATHYYMQGPTFDSNNLWDPAETLNLKDKGALKGTDVKDLCGLVGGASAGDTINIKAIDGYNENFEYVDVYTPEPAQGPMVICWWKDGQYAGPSYAEAMQLVFFAQTTNAEGKYVFGHQDMHDCLPESNWHYYYSGGINYPSANGLSIKYISEINIYTSGVDEWELELTGASSYTMSQGEFENGVACHGAATWTDDSGNVWSGMPLWLLVGWVDDIETHGPGAFNDELAATGYDVTVIASDAYSKTFASATVARNNSMIVANMMNGAPLPEDKYPLKLVGPGLTGGQMVSKIVEIRLSGLPEPPANSVAVTANVIIPMVGISLNRTQINYGDIMPGRASAVETVGIENTGNVPVNVTLEVEGANAAAQSFYAQSLYVESALYNAEAVIASIPVAGTDNVDTQLRVPASWTGGGNQNATFIFWAEAQ